MLYFCPPVPLSSSEGTEGGFAFAIPLPRPHPSQRRYKREREAPTAFIPDPHVLPVRAFPINQSHLFQGQEDALDVLDVGEIRRVHAYQPAPLASPLEANIIRRRHLRRGPQLSVENALAYCRPDAVDVVGKRKEHPFPACLVQFLGQGEQTLGQGRAEGIDLPRNRRLRFRRHIILDPPPPLRKLRQHPLAALHQVRDVGRGPPRGERVGDPDPGPVDRGRCAGGRKAAEELIEGFGELLRGAVAFVGVVGFLRRRGGGGDVFQGEGGGGGEGGGKGFGGEVRGEGVVGTGEAVEVFTELSVA